MKRITHVLVLILFFSCGSLLTAEAQMSIGIKAGPNFASINTEASADQNYKSRTGFHGGGFVLFKFNRVGIQPEVLFSQQGSKVTINQDDFKSNFSYINVPIIVKLYTVAGINLQVGPQFGFLTTAKSNYDPTTGQQFNSTEDVSEAYEKSDVSLALGVGWDLPFGLTVDGRYNWGLSDIKSGGGSSVKNQVWQFSVGYKLFTLGKDQ
jgi:hypothetical protein